MKAEWRWAEGAKKHTEKEKRGGTGRENKKVTAPASRRVFQKGGMGLSGRLNPLTKTSSKKQPPPKGYRLHSIKSIEKIPKEKQKKRVRPGRGPSRSGKRKRRKKRFLRAEKERVGKKPEPRGTKSWRFKERQTGKRPASMIRKGIPTL